MNELAVGLGDEHLDGVRQSLGMSSIVKEVVERKFEFDGKVNLCVRLALVRH